MASEAEILGEGMRRITRSFEHLLEEHRFGYMLNGIIVGFDCTCATPFRNPEQAPSRMGFAKA